MAGIIGQLTANARKRKERQTVRSDKSTYYIPEFDRNGFNPSLHNKFMRIRKQMDASNLQRREYMEEMVITKT